MGHFVKPEVTQLALSTGDWIRVKRRLNAGEYHTLRARISEEKPDGDIRVNNEIYPLELICAYLLDWSLTDDDGQVVMISGQPLEYLQATVNALKIETFGEIFQLIVVHQSGQQAAREQEKKDRTGETASAPILELQGAAAGATNGY